MPAIAAPTPPKESSRKKEETRLTQLCSKRGKGKRGLDFAAGTNPEREALSASVHSERKRNTGKKKKDREGTVFSPREQGRKKREGRCFDRRRSGLPHRALARSMAHGGEEKKEEVARADHEGSRAEKRKRRGRYLSGSPSVGKRKKRA